MEWIKRLLSKESTDSDGHPSSSEARSPNGFGTPRSPFGRGGSSLWRKASADQRADVDITAIPVVMDGKGQTAFTFEDERLRKAWLQYVEVRGSGDETEAYEFLVQFHDTFVLCDSGAKYESKYSFAGLASQASMASLLASHGHPIGMLRHLCDRAVTLIEATQSYMMLYMRAAGAIKRGGSNAELSQTKAFLDVAAHPPTSMLCKECALVLQLLGWMARFPNNALILHRTNFLVTVITLINSVVDLYRSVWVINRTSVSYSSASMMSSLLAVAESLLKPSILFIHNVIDPFHAWRFSQQGGAHYSSRSLSQSAIGVLESHGKILSKCLHDFCLMSHDQLSSSPDAALKNDLYPVFMQHLSTAGSFVSISNKALKDFHTERFCKMLVSQIDLGMEEKDSTNPQERFYMSLTCMELLRVIAMYDSLLINIRATATQLERLLQWTARRFLALISDTSTDDTALHAAIEEMPANDTLALVCSGFGSKRILIMDGGLQSFCFDNAVYSATIKPIWKSKELSALFCVMLGMLMRHEDPRDIQGTASNLDTCVANVVVRFLSTSQLNSSDADFSLQQYAVHFLHQALLTRDDLLEILEHGGLFEILVSSRFQLSRDSKVSEDARVALRGRVLRRQVLQLIAFMSTLPESPNRAGATVALVRLLVGCLWDETEPSIVTDVCHCLIRIRQHKFDHCSAAFKECKAAQRILSLALLQSESNAAETSESGLAALSVLALLGYVLAEPAASVSATSRRALDLFQRMILVPGESETKNKLGLVLLTDVMTTLRLASEQKQGLLMGLEDTVVSLYQEYVNMLTSAELTSGTCALLWLGFRRVAMVRPVGGDSLFEACGIFDVLPNVLRSHLAIANAGLGRAFLSALTALLHDDFVCREQMQKRCGYGEYLSSFLARCFSNDPNLKESSSLLVLAIIDLICGHNSVIESDDQKLGVSRSLETIDTPFEIKNASAVRLLFASDVYCAMGNREKIWVLETFTLICSVPTSMGVRNLALCASESVKVLDSLLGLFPIIVQFPDDESGVDTAEVDECIFKYKRASRFAGVCIARAVELLEVLIAHSINVRQLKWCFSLLRNQSVSVVDDRGVRHTYDTRPWYSTFILRMLQKSARNSGPTNFSLLDGVSGGLKLPPVENWVQKGFTFSAWVNVLSFQKPGAEGDDDKQGRPRIFHFSTERDEQGEREYIELYFQEGYLVYEVAVRERRGLRRNKTVVRGRCLTKKWTHICVTQNLPTTFNHSEVLLYIDGKCQVTRTLVGEKAVYPYFRSPLLHCYLGTDGAEPAPNAVWGYLGPVYLLSGATPMRGVELIYGLGSDYCYNFDQESLYGISAKIEVQDRLARDSAIRRVLELDGDSGGQQFGTDVFVGQEGRNKTDKVGSDLASNIILAFNARSTTAIDGGRVVYLDNSPKSTSSINANRSERWLFPMHAVAMPGCIRCVQRRVGDILECLGGIEVLYPLLSQLDLPVRYGGTDQKVREAIGPHIVDAGMDAVDQKRVFLYYAADPTFLVLSIDLMSAVLQAALSKESDHASRASSLIGRDHSYCFSVIASKIEAGSSAARTPALVHAFDRLLNGFFVAEEENHPSHRVRVVRSRAGSRAGRPRFISALSKSLYFLCFWEYFGNLELWSAASEETQKVWISVLNRHVHQFGFLFRAGEVASGTFSRFGEFGAGVEQKQSHRQVPSFDGSAIRKLLSGLARHFSYRPFRTAESKEGEEQMKKMLWVSKIRQKLLTLLQHSLSVEVFDAHEGNMHEDTDLITVGEVREIVLALCALEDVEEILEVLQVFVVLLHESPALVLRHLYFVCVYNVRGNHPEPVTVIESTVDPSDVFRVCAQFLTDFLRFEHSEVVVLVARTMNQLLRVHDDPDTLQDGGSQRRYHGSARSSPALRPSEERRSVDFDKNLALPSALRAEERDALKQMQRMMERYQGAVLTEDVYLALLSIALDDDITAANVERYRFSSGALIRRSHAFSVIFALVQKSDSFHLVREIMQDLMNLISASDLNRSKILGASDWASWFMRIFTLQPQQFPHYSVIEGDTEEEREKQRSKLSDKLLVARLYSFRGLKSILFTSMRMKNGWVVFQETLARLRLYYLQEEKHTMCLPFLVVLTKIVRDQHELVYQEKQLAVNTSSGDSSPGKLQAFFTLVYNAERVALLALDTLLHYRHNASSYASVELCESDIESILPAFYGTVSVSDAKPYAEEYPVWPAVRLIIGIIDWAQSVRRQVAASMERLQNATAQGIVHGHSVGLTSPCKALILGGEEKDSPAQHSRSRSPSEAVTLLNLLNSNRRKDSERSSVHSVDSRSASSVSTSSSNMDGWKFNLSLLLQVDLAARPTTGLSPSYIQSLLYTVVLIRQALDVPMGPVSRMVDAEALDAEFAEEQARAEGISGNLASGYSSPRLARAVSLRGAVLRRVPVHALKEQIELLSCFLLTLFERLGSLSLETESKLNDSARKLSAGLFAAVVDVSVLVRTLATEVSDHAHETSVKPSAIWTPKRGQANSLPDSATTSALHNASAFDSKASPSTKSKKDSEAIAGIPALPADVRVVPPLQDWLAADSPADERIARWLKACAAFFINGDQWQKYVAMLGPGADYVERLHGGCQRRISSFEDIVCTTQERTRASGVSRLDGALTAQVTSLVRMRADGDQSRRERRMRELKSKWIEVMRTFMGHGEQGSPWSAPGKKDPDAATYWKLDSTENPSRMRVKMKRNHNFRSHRECVVDDWSDRKTAVTTDGGVDASLLEVAKNIVPEEQEDLVRLERANTFNDPDVLDSSVAGEERELELAPVTTLDLEEQYMCQLVVPETGSIDGILLLTGSYLSFEATRDAAMTNPPEVDAKWLLIRIRSVHYRRYNLRRCAMEVFLNSMQSFFFVLKDEDERNECYVQIKKASKAMRRSYRGAGILRESMMQRNRGIQSSGALRRSLMFNYEYKGRGRWASANAMASSQLTEAWCQRQISNFEYLMHLNTIAGRTFNDLTQYPVFPWVLSDYTSEKIDLNDPSVYRDLGKPVGALNAKRLKQLRERCASMDDTFGIPKFLYGTHYSCAGYVLWYLMRVEPFTSMNIKLHDNKFNRPDRMFLSIPNCWEGCVNNAADVKELIPEFFFLPEMLRNENGFDFGKRQSGNPVGDVELPKWASSAEEFIRINRAALESEYVSMNLHKWIDLIFGYKQNGEEALKADNVFFHLTYEGAVDLDKIDNESERKAVISQINHFGQTPTQLLTTPHPQRYAREDIISSIFSLQVKVDWYADCRVTTSYDADGESNGSAVERKQSKPAPRVMESADSNEEDEVEEDAAPNTAGHENPLLAIVCMVDTVLTLGVDREIGLHKWRNSTPESVPPFRFELDKRKHKSRRIGTSFASGFKILPSYFCVSVCQKFLVSAGHWDCSFRVSEAHSGEHVCAVHAHQDVVTCLSLSSDGKTLVSGSRDTTIMVWRVGFGVNVKRLTGGSIVGDEERRMSYIDPSAAFVLHGHHAEVTCVWMSSDFDVIVSGSGDGSVILHVASTGTYVRRLEIPINQTEQTQAVRWVGVSNVGLVVVASVARLDVFTINGKHMCGCELKERVYTWLFSQDGNSLVSGGEKGRVLFRNTHDLQVVRTISTRGGPVRSLAVSTTEQHLLVGFQSGHMQIYALEAAYLRKRFLQKLTNLGF